MAEKKYTFAGLHKGNVVGTAVGYVEGWVVRDVDMRYTPDGKPVTNTALALNNVSKKLAYALQMEIPEAESTFVDIAGWENVAERLQKVVKKGALIGVSGALKTEEYEGKTRLRFTVQDFQIRVYPKNDSAPKEPVGAGASQEPKDDDLPF